MISKSLRFLRILSENVTAFFLKLGMARIAVGCAGLVVFVLVCFMLFTAGWSRPPIVGVQTGYRGSDQALIYNPRTVKAQMASTDFQETPPPADSSGPRASQVWKNVQVLGNLSVGQFLRLMQGMADAVAPEQGCSYCHANGNYASDALYTKRVARRMLQMTREINTKWSPHVGDVGVTCYTCHRGHHVPQNVWANQVAGVTNEGSTSRFMPNSENGYASLPADLYHSYLKNDAPINVQGTYAMPNGNPADIKDTERTFGLMIHWANALGVNCSFCHNSRAFASWGGASGNHKIRAWYGLHMLRELNNTYMGSLTDTFPSSLEGPDGKPFGIDCSTCHQGVYKPLYGQKVIDAYPSLAVPNNSAGNGHSIPASAPKPGSLDRSPLTGVPQAPKQASMGSETSGRNIAERQPESPPGRSSGNGAHNE